LGRLAHLFYTGDWRRGPEGEFTFRRGFLEELNIFDGSFITHAQQLLEDQPILRVTLMIGSERTLLGKVPAGTHRVLFCDGRAVRDPRAGPLARRVSSPIFPCLARANPGLVEYADDDRVDFAPETNLVRAVSRAAVAYGRDQVTPKLPEVDWRRMQEMEEVGQI
jgi:hypothetical protein